jgi:cytochrome c
MKFRLLAPFLILAGGASAAPLARQVIAEGLRDPMEIAIAPDGDLYVVEREGRILRVHPPTGGTFEVAQLEVQALREAERDSNYAREDGLLGIALDPAFATNQRLYLYYSHPREIVNRLSRFQLKDGRLDLESEMKILDVPSERERRACHQGGSVEFGPDGLLYLSTGDNTNPFESDGYSPINDQEGHDHADAMRTAGNANDLRGKILRIRPTEDGYEIPEGNLFPPGTEKTRPEIYVMGCRNPFRISIDPQTQTLYWGEVGPDAHEDSEKGPRGHDEVNQAKAAGNFGWPFVIANNQPYPIRNFATGGIGPLTDPAAPVNPGSRNTGPRELPAARPALIWYPYAESAEFPIIGKGGRNAMAGPVFYFDENRTHNILSQQDDRTLLTYEWMRGKIYKAKLDEKENLQNLEVLVEGLVHPMDLEMADDGSLWLLEYGSEWYFNKNGRILRILPESGNQPPKIAIEPIPGSERGFRIKEATDPDGDPVTVTWFLTVGTSEQQLGNSPSITLPTTGGSEIRAVASDGKGGSAIARISLGDEGATPTLALKFSPPPSSLAFGQPLAFEVTSDPAPADSGVTVRARYIPPTGHDAGGPQFSTAIHSLVTANQCLACHQLDHPSVGPSYLNVALRYQERPDALAHIKTQLKNGSAGVWGEVPMPAQIALKDDDADTIVRAILGLAEGISETRGSAKGQIKLAPAPEGAAPGGAWEITASAPGYSPAKLRLPAK